MNQQEYNFQKPLSTESNGKAEPVTAYFRVYGLNCPRCAARVRNAFYQTSGVMSAIVDHQDGLAEVKFDPGQTTISALIQSVTNAGDGLHHCYSAEYLE